MGNDKKNELKGKQFTSDYQPSPTAKSKGWDRRRRAQEIMDKLLEIQDMSVEDYLALRQEIKSHPEKHTMLEQLMVGYVERLGRSDNLVRDYLDRHVPRAKELDITTNGESINTNIDLSKLTADEIIRLAELTNKATDK